MKHSSVFLTFGLGHVFHCFDFIRIWFMTLLLITWPMSLTCGFFIFILLLFSLFDFVPVSWNRAVWLPLRSTCKCSESYLDPISSSLSSRGFVALSRIPVAILSLITLSVNVPNLHDEAIFLNRFLNSSEPCVAELNWNLFWTTSDSGLKYASKAA